jgi:hypothetical protein
LRSLPDAGNFQKWQFDGDHGNPKFIKQMLADEQTSRAQVEAFRRMTPGRRLALAEKLYWSAREWKAAGLRAQHPNWSEEQVLEQVRHIFSNART